MRHSIWILLALTLTGCTTTTNPALCYQGHGLNYWLRQARQNCTNFNPIAQDRYQVAAQAVRTIGTNAIPALLAQTRKSNNWQGRNAAANSDAVMGFDLLGYRGSSAIPALLNLVENTRNQSVQCTAGFDLMGLGLCLEKATPRLLQMTTNQNDSIATWGFTLLNTLPDGPPRGQQQAMAALDRTNLMLRLEAMKLLEQRGPAAKNAVPKLIRLAASTNHWIHAMAIQALAGIHSDPQKTIPVLIENLSNQPPNGRLNAIWGLQQFGPLARAALPQLRELTHNSNARTRQYATEAIAHIQ